MEWPVAELDLPPCHTGHPRRHCGEKEGHDTPKYGLLFAAAAGCLPCVRYWHEKEGIPLDSTSDNHRNWDVRSYADWHKNDSDRHWEVSDYLDHRLACLPMNSMRKPPRRADVSASSTEAPISGTPRAAVAVMPPISLFVIGLRKGLDTEMIKSDFETDDVQMKSNGVSVMTFSTTEAAQKALTWDNTRYKGAMLRILWAKE